MYLKKKLNQIHQILLTQLFSYNKIRSSIIYDLNHKKKKIKTNELYLLTLFLNVLSIHIIILEDIFM